MPKGKNQKFKLYRLAQIMLEQTDEEHYITMPEIMSALAEYEITADRKSIYADLKDLEELGIEIDGERIGSGYHYHVIGRNFELPELKLLVDAIQSSKFITENKKIKHYRVDKILRIQMSKEEREGKEHFQKLDMADYAKKSFGMFGGKEQTVKLLVHNSLAGVIIDRFGKDIMMIPEDEQYFTVNVDVHISRQFLGWVFSLGEQVRILKPTEVVVEMKKEIKRLNQQC